tara:strand:- start:438 stop:998 length:561 start_codon:yes stop_codon:yes gene_type:complete
MGTLTLLRHGQTDYNAKSLFQGRVDEPLNAVGLAQAHRAAGSIGKVDRIISSPLQRARKTAEAFGMSPEIDERWVECNFGDWEGRPISSIGTEKWEKYKSNLDYQPPNGESINEVNQRIHSALDELSVGENENLLIVTHTLPIKSAFVWVLGVEIPILRTRLSTASYTQIEFSGVERTLLNFNITS